LTQSAAYINNSTKISESNNNPGRQYTAGAGPRGSLKSADTNGTADLRRNLSSAAYGGGVSAFNRNGNKLNLAQSSGDMFGHSMAVNKQ